MGKHQEPGWLSALRKACDTYGQAEVTRMLQRSGDRRYPSPAVINQALKGTYGGNIERLRGVVEGVLMSMSVDCPVIGELPRQRCMEYQRREFAATNPLRVVLARECPECPFNSGQKRPEIQGGEL